MFGIDDLIIYTGLIGGMTIAGETASVIIKNRKHKTQKLATSLIGLISDLEGLIDKDGIKLSKTIQLSSKKSYEHILCVGATGEHKTTSLFYPNLLSPDIKGSIIVTDPKCELYRDTAQYQKSIGRIPILFSPLSPINSINYNLLQECKSTTEVIELAQCILLNGSKALELTTGVKAGGIEWLNMSNSLLSASLLYCKSKGSPLNTITNAIRLIINNTTENLDLLFSNAAEEVREQYNIFKSSMESPKTASSIKITLASNMQLFLDSAIIQSTKDSGINAAELRNKPICLYISYPEHMSNYLSPFMSSFFTQVIKQLIDIQGIPITFMFDEFANVGMINNLSNIISTCRSREIGFLCCLQSISQLIQVYGRDNAKSILNSLKTKVILPSISDIETLEYLSNLAGETEIQIKNTSQNDNKTITNYSTTKKKLFNTDEIRRIKSDEILIIAHNKQPVIDKQNIYYLNSEYTSKIKVCNY